MPPDNIPSAHSGPSLLAEYRERTPKSRALAEQAAGLFPSGVTHDLRYQDPYPIYVSKALGPRKWDVDGNEYIDYIGGHGALLLGHSHPDVAQAVAAQAGLATHPGAAHAHEVHWASIIQALMPSLARLRFTASGTEATMMAYRLAREATGKSKIVQFAGHFHGWQDHAVSGYEAGHSGRGGNKPPPGILSALSESGVILAPGDESQVAETLAKDDDIAAVIVEPTGAHFGATPLDPTFLAFLRDITRQQGCLLIFDEVVTGFRVSPGGFQTLAGIDPDLTTLGKIMAGGLPGGAVGGRQDILELIDVRATAAAGRRKIGHPGTFNANPLSAAAGITALSLVKDSDVCQTANEQGAGFRAHLNEILENVGLPWAVYGSYSGFHLFTNPAGRDIRPSSFDPATVPPAELTGNDAALVSTLRLAMLVNGVDLSPRFSGFLSAVHTEADIEQTAAAFQRALESLIGDAIITL